MAHNQKMLEERGKDWGKQVRLIGLSIDNDAQTVKNHVEAKGWNSVEHYHVRTAGCTADKDYGVQGVPHVLLVDTKGKIVFVGHPASRKLEEDIDKLLKGETLSGEGTGQSAAEEGEKSSNAATEEEVEKSKTEFIANAKQYMADNQEELQKLARGFLVLVDEASYDVKSQKLSHNMSCIT